jgi:hypothetical protein
MNRPKSIRGRSRGGRSSAPEGIDSVGEIRGGLPERSKKEQNIPDTQCHYRTLINYQPDQPS